MAKFTENRFPQYAEQIREMAEAHKEFKDEPMHLAICYAPKKKGKDIYLFEAVQNFGMNEPDPARDLFQVSFPGSEDFPMENGQRLYLTLTNPHECKIACQENWHGMKTIRKAIAEGNYEVLFADKIGKKLMGVIQQ
ncbi:MAG: hypothetical protein NTX50_01540 [Candidatus Sumerlaeota bacterium]|nr:hypothetical protein [Candidatus Sumerlaeota bacterium]